MENNIMEAKLDLILKNQEEIKEKVSEIDMIKEKVSRIDEIEEKVDKIDRRVMVMEEEYLKKIQMALNGLAMHIETHQAADQMKNILLNHQIRIELLEDSYKKIMGDTKAH